MTLISRSSSKDAPVPNHCRSRVSSVKLKDTFIVSCWYLNSNSISDLIIITMVQVLLPYAHCHVSSNSYSLLNDYKYLVLLVAMPCEQQDRRLVEWLLGPPLWNDQYSLYKCFASCTSSMPYYYWYELVVLHTSRTVFPSHARTPNT